MVPSSVQKTVSVICPVHNEERSIPYFYERFVKVREQLADRYRLNLMFVNNASSDNTLRVIKQLREQDPYVEVISHSRNFGYQASVLCGLSNTDSDAYVVIDADCEDPPELITTFVSKWEEGYDIVYGQRAIRPENHAIVAARRLFYRLTHLIADWEFIIDMAEFSLFSDRVRRQVLRHRSTFPFVRSDLAFAGFRRHGIPYAREPRRFGETHYNLIRMTKFAIGGILSASTFPLRAIAYFGFPLAAVDLVYAFVALFGYRAGLTSIAILNLAFVVTSLAFLAMYIARIAKDVIGRPVFVIDAEQTHLNRPLDSESDLHYQTQARNV